MKTIPSRYTKTRLKVAAMHPDAKVFIEARKIWAERWKGKTFTGSVDLAYCAVSLAEYQALTSDAQYEPMLEGYCKQLAHGKLTDITPETIYVNNPEPIAIQIARAAAMVPSALAVLEDLLGLLLSRLHSGTHGWPDKGGKSALCRVKIQQSLREQCFPLEDYGESRGGRWILENIYSPEGWNRSLSGSFWYTCLNDAVIEMCWDSKADMTPEELAKFTAIYNAPYYFQMQGETPIVGEDAEKNRSKSYKLFNRPVRTWRGANALTQHMKWQAKNTLGFPTHFDDLLISPCPKDCPAGPALPTRTSFPPYVEIFRGKVVDVCCYRTPHPSVGGSHTGSGAPMTVIKPVTT